MRIEVASGAPSQRAAAAPAAVVHLCHARGALRRSCPAFPSDPPLDLAMSRFFEAVTAVADAAIATAVEHADDLRAADAGYRVTEEHVARAAR